MIDHRVLAAEVVKRRRRRDGPLKRGRLPGVLRRSLPYEQAPKEVEEENQLSATSDERRDGHKRMHGDQVLHEDDFRELRIAPDVTFKSDEVHRHEDAIDPNEGEPEMNLAQGLVHHAAEHLGKPEES